MKKVYIVAAKRTPIGRFQGSLKSFSAPQLGSIAIKSALESASVPLEAIERVLMGQVLTAGVGQAPARQALLGAGLPEHVQAITIGKVCGSGLQAVISGAQGILAGDVDVVVAGGQENMSNAPYLLPQARDGYRMGHREVTDSMIRDGLWDPYNNIHMGSCAEMCARDFKISREEQDAYAQESYRRAREAVEKGLFKAEIQSLSVPSGKNQVLFENDEEPFASDLQKMSQLKPAFEKEGTITAANASSINDGASALILASEEAVRKYSLKPLAQILSYGFHAQSPLWFSTAPIQAMENALKRAQLSAQDIDLFEINEAFALVPIAAMRKLSIPHDRLNIHGGACALGHPIGASGARILTTLVHALKEKNKKYGMASLCIGGGEGIALLLERC